MFGNKPLSRLYERYLMHKSTCILYIMNRFPIRAIMASPSVPEVPGAHIPIDYYLVLDFEATCDNATKVKPQEIIEFPVLKVNAKTMQTESVFHTYVQPTAHPILTPFCTELTGITQDKVDGQPILQEVLEEFDKWMSENNLVKPQVNSCFVTCGDWDLKTMLPSQCKYFKLPIRDYFRKWINIKKVFEEATGQKAKGMPGMLTTLGLRLDGRHHSGIDDSKNIAKILVELAKVYPSMQPTMTLPPFRF